MNTGITKTMVLTLGLAVFALAHAHTADAANATNTAESDAEAVRQELAAARQAVEEARQTAEQMLASARQEADLIRAAAAKDPSAAQEESTDLPDLGPVAIRNAPVAVEVAAGTVEEIAAALLPPGWRVLVDVQDVTLQQRRFQYVSTKTRDHALLDLLLPIGLQHQYFFELKDASGNVSPLLVISKR